MPNATAPAATAIEKTIFFTWKDNSGIANAAPTDTAIVVVYCKELNKAHFTWQGPARSEGAG